MMNFMNLNHKWHLTFAGLIRAVFILVGTYFDSIGTVQYTDVDYKVFTDAAHHVIANGSPYDRHTYRYSPLIAFLLIPNHTLHKSFGKVLFSLIDLIVAVVIREIVKFALKEYDAFKQNDFQINKPNMKMLRQRKRKNHEIKSEHDHHADVAMMLWLYNPVSVVVATRGSCDSIAGLLVLLTLYFLQCKRQPFISGLIHGISVHLRLYPICYSLTFFMYLSKFSYYLKPEFIKPPGNAKEIKNIENRIMQSRRGSNTIFKKEYLMYLVPNFDQFKLVSGCLLSLISLTYLFYHVYGFKFLYETYIFHLIRKDTRHNFSIYFYLQYLTAGVKNIGLWQKVLIVLPQIVLLSVFSFRYGLNRFSLNFGVLAQTIVMVTYNTVITAQYFLWIWVVLPLCLWQIKMNKRTAVSLMGIWLAAEAAWLLPAYYLEFQGQNTFLFIWLQSVSFFCANIAILGRLIMKYMPAKQYID